MVIESASTRQAPRFLTVPAPQKALRPDIQLLRAVAVGAVLLYHLWPNRMTGGFVGVDVFFVISGFLITSHLLKSAIGAREFTLARSTGTTGIGCLAADGCVDLVVHAGVDLAVVDEVRDRFCAVRAELDVGKRLGQLSGARPDTVTHPALLVVVSGRAVLHLLAAAHHGGVSDRVADRDAIG